MVMPMEYMHLVFTRINVWRVTSGDVAVDVTGGDISESDAFASRTAIVKAWHSLPIHQRVEFGQQLEQWEKGAEAEHDRGWRCYLVKSSGDASRRQIEMSSTWSGVPLETITQQLNELAGDGWRVVAVSEDRGLYLGIDTHDESYPARLRYLLERTRS
jgi:hypothetical protein